MRYIQKNRRGIGYQKLLKIHKSKGSYEDTQNDKSKIPKITTRTDILKDLLNEQGSICAYCMRSISLENATIEHIVSQNYVDNKGRAIGKEEDTNYDNMLAVCQGNFCLKQTHCDKSRSIYQDKEPLLAITPLNKLQMSSIKFTQSGVVYYEKLDEKSKINDELNRVLNLNCDGMIEMRGKIIRAIKHTLVKRKFNKKFIQKELLYWEKQDSSLRPYCQVAIFELKKYI